MVSNAVRADKYGNDWSTASTLSETVYRLVERKLTHTPEFKTLLKYYGRDKLKLIYAAEKDKRAPTLGLAERRLGEKDED